MIGLFTLAIAFAAFVASSIVFGVDSRTDSADSRRADYPVGIR
jgi:hypothetical protein